MQDSPTIKLPDALEAYRHRRPSKATREAEEIDGSEMELKIATYLVLRGWSDEEIVAYFERERFPRYLEEGSDSGTRSRIGRARLSYESFCAEDREHASLPANEHALNPPPTRVSEIDHDPGSRLYDSGQLRFLVLEERRKAEERGDPFPTLTEWRKEIIDVSETLLGRTVSPKTAQRISDDLRRNRNVRYEAIDGKRKTVHLTEKGLRASRRVKGKWCQLIPGRARRSLPSRPLADPTVARAAPPMQKRKPSRRPRRVRPGERRRRRIESLRKTQQINGYHRITFGGNKVRYLTFLTSQDEWLATELWPSLLIGFDEYGLPVYRTIPVQDITRLVDDPLRAMLPRTWKPRQKWFASAVELVKNDDGFTVGEYADANGELNPAIGVVFQSRFNFWPQPGDHRLTERVIRVKGTGSGRGRRYTFEDVGPAPALTATFDFDGFVATLEDDALLAAVSKLPTGWFSMPYRRQQLIHRLTGDPQP